MDDKKMTFLNKFLSYVVIPGAVLYIFITDMGVIGRHNWIIAIAGVCLVGNIILNAVYRNKKNPEYHYEVGTTYTKVLTGFVILELILNSGLFS